MGGRGGSWEIVGDRGKESETSGAHLRPQLRKLGVVFDGGGELLLGDDLVAVGIGEAKEGLGEPL